MASTNYLINFQTNVAPIEQAMASVATKGQAYMAQLRAAANVPLATPALGPGGGISGGAGGQQLQAELTRLQNEKARIIGQSQLTQDNNLRLSDQRQLAALSAQQQAALAAANPQVFRTINAQGQNVAASAAQAQATRTGISRQLAAQEAELIQLNRQAVVAKRAENAIRDRQVRLEVEDSLATQRLTAAKNTAATQVVGGRPGQLTAGVGAGVRRQTRGDLGQFFGSGLATTLRFALPSVALFGAIGGIANAVRQAEELEQIFVRVEGQLEAISAQGNALIGLGGLSDITGVLDSGDLATVEDALDRFKETVFNISTTTGVAADEVGELQQAFIGLFSSVEEGAVPVQLLAERATEITGEFTVITGLSPEETFNDLVGAVRTFAETGPELIDLLDNITTSVINVSDVTGVSAGEITDFLGRIGPAATQAGFELEEVSAIAAAALQGSGVGGAALAEQFGRVLTGFSGELGTELAAVAQEFEGLEEFDGSGFTVENIFAGNVSDVLFGLINNFDSLSDAQQRQIVQSVGSRREGATLAAVLQNAATVTEALSAATDQNVSRQERFEDIIARLTGQFSILRAETSELGQRLFEAGIDDLLQAIVSALGSFVEGLGIIATPLEGFSNLISKLPEDLLKTVAGVTALAGAFRLISRTAGIQAATGGAGLLAALNPRNAASFQLSAVTGAQAATATAANAGLVGAFGAGAAGAGAAQQASRLSRLGAATRALGPAALIAGVGITALLPLIKDLGGESEFTEEQQRSFRESLVRNGDQFQVAALQAESYARNLSRISEAQDDVAGFDLSGIESGVNNTAAVVRSIIEGLATTEGKEGAFDALNQLAASLGVTTEEFLETILQNNVNVKNLAEQTAARTRELEPGTPRGQQSAGIRFDEAVEQNRSEFENSITEKLLQLGLEDVESLDTGFDLLARLVDENQQANEDAQRRLGTVINIAVANQEVTGITQAQVDELRAALGDDNNFAIIKELGIIDFGTVVPQQTEEARRNLQEITIQLEAGLASQSEFLEVANEELDSLRGLYNEASAQSGFNPAAAESAGKLLKEIVDLESKIAQQARARLDADIELAAFLGRPIEGADLIATILASIETNVELGSGEQLGELVRILIGERRDIVQELISEAENLEEAQAIRAREERAFDDSELSSLLAQDIFAGDSATATAINNVLAAASVVGEARESTINELANSARNRNDVIAILRTKIEESIVSLQEAIAELSEEVTSQEQRANLEGRLEAAQGQLANLPNLNILTPAEFVLTSNEAFEEAVADFEDRILKQFNQNEAAISSAGGDDAGARASRLVALIQSGGITAGTDAAVGLANDLTSLVSEYLAASTSEQADFEAALQGQIDAANGGIAQFASAEITFQLISQADNSFNRFLRTYLEAGTEIFDGLLRQISQLAASGADSVQALAQIARAAQQQARAQIQQFRSLLDIGAISAESFAQEESRILEEARAFIQAAEGRDILGVDIQPIRITPRSSGGGAADKANELLEAERALARALVAEDAVALAELEVAISDEDAVNALGNRVEELRAATAQIGARASLEQAMLDVFNAEQELAIAVLESQGNIPGALAAGVDVAQRNLDFLREAGAGAAQIAAAELAILNAQNAQQEGLTQAQLGELDFLFNIGDLSTQAYIAALQGILDQLDPVADVDLWRQISLQIKGLKDSSNELQFNLPDSFDLPTLYEVRRLNQGSFNGADALQLGTSTTDNRQYSIEINVQTGMDWDDARDILADALGADTNVFSLGTRRY